MGAVTARMYIEAIIITNIPQAEIGMTEVYCLRVGRPLNEAVIVIKTVQMSQENSVFIQ